MPNVPWVIRFHPSKEVFEVPHGFRAMASTIRFHPSKEVFEAWMESRGVASAIPVSIPLRKFLRLTGKSGDLFVSVGFHPSKEVFEALTQYGVEWLGIGFHPSKEVFEASARVETGGVVLMFPSL